MINELKNELNMTLTENGAATYESSLSACVDLFATIGALRDADEAEIETRFLRAFAENRLIAMKILFFARDIREGLGERRVFRIIIRWLAQNEPECLRKNIALLNEYGRYDDMIACFDTACEKDVLLEIKNQLELDLNASGTPSLLAKWLPSINASSKKTRYYARRIAKYLGYSDEKYRKVLVELRKKLDILENNLRTRDYSFDYEKQPSLAMCKYRSAFMRNDGERYGEFLKMVATGQKKMNTGALFPYDIVSKCLWESDAAPMSANERQSLDVTWNALESIPMMEDAICVIDGSGSMYCGDGISPISVALSLGIYFGEHNNGAFKNQFITFSKKPKLVTIKGQDILEKVRYCASYNEIANTNLLSVFKLILKTAIESKAKASEMPKRLYIISDMEFDCCMEDADMTNFAFAKQMFHEAGYTLPEVVFWNVNSLRRQQPVLQNEQGVCLVSGCSPRLFSLVVSDDLSPYNAMLDILMSKRYEKISA